MLQGTEPSVVRSQHYVPRHYLRQFGYPGTEQISLARIEPYHYVARASIGGQCQEDYFYGDDGQVDGLLQMAEQDLSPVLPDVCKNNSFNKQELNALSMMTVLLHMRTRKAVAKAKLVPKMIFFKVVDEAIKSGKLPPPPDGWTPDMADVGGVPGFLIAHSIPCWLETFTLTPKLLRAPATTAFITSDHPVILLNQFAQGAHPLRPFCGFGQSGFQILLPLSPRHCLFFYDPKTYKAGTRNGQLIDLQEADVATINALEIQSAERCIYFNDAVPENVARNLVGRNQGLRKPIDDALRLYPGTNPEEELLHFREPALKVVRPWSFCRRLENPKARPGDRRDVLWTDCIQRLMDDLEQGRLQGDLSSHFSGIISGRL